VRSAERVGVTVEEKRRAVSADARQQLEEIDRIRAVPVTAAETSVLVPVRLIAQPGDSRFASTVSSSERVASPASSPRGRGCRSSSPIGPAGRNSLTLPSAQIAAGPTAFPWPNAPPPPTKRTIRNRSRRSIQTGMPIPDPKATPSTIRPCRNRPDEPTRATPRTR
jgi:hypothetical protein